MKSKLFFKQGKNFLSKENKIFIEKTVFGNMFGWFLSDVTADKTSETSAPFLSHTVLKRLDEHPIEKCITSNCYKDTLHILHNFCKSINERPNLFLRINYNLTFSVTQKKPFIHTDHSCIDYKQIIIYLNDVTDKKATTCILDENKKVVKEIIPEKYKGVCFGRNLHYGNYPKENARIILVATYI